VQLQQLPLDGVFGLKPSYGRVPKLWEKISFNRLSHNGPITRFVKDAALMLDAISSYSSVDKYSLSSPEKPYIESLKEIPKRVKIGYSLDLGDVKALDPEIKKKILESLDKFEKLDWPVEEIKIKLKQLYRSFISLVTAGYAYDYSKYLKDWEEKMTPTFVNMIRAGISYTGMDIMHAELQSIKIYNQFTEYFKHYDILITPTTAVTAFELGKMYPDQIEGKTVSPVGWMPFTYPFNLTGHPAASIPCGWSAERLPIGMQIVGPSNDDKLVLQVSKAFEEISPWQNRRPDFD